jgi:hypothetical protein
VQTQQYIASVAGGPAATCGRRYVFGQIDRSTYSTQFRSTYTLKPDMNLDVYAEPFAASGHYTTSVSWRRRAHARAGPTARTVQRPKRRPMAACS